MKKTHDVELFYVGCFMGQTGLVNKPYLISRISTMIKERNSTEIL